MKTVAVTACSDGRNGEYLQQLSRMESWFASQGLGMRSSRCILARKGPFSGSARERAAELNAFFADPDISEIYDVSGGDLANQVLPWLDYDAIAGSRAELWGYSDLTCVLNAIYARTGRSSVLWQVNHMFAGGFQQLQRERYLQRDSLFLKSADFLQGQRMEGTLVGGNIRCFLKLAGTPYFPDCRGRILLLEARSGQSARMAACLAQLEQMDIFRRISGLLLGTFTEMEAEGCTPDLLTLVREVIPAELPLAVTSRIGHGKDALAVRIGAPLSLQA